MKINLQAYADVISSLLRSPSSTECPSSMKSSYRQVPTEVTSRNVQTAMMYSILIERFLFGELSLMKFMRTEDSRVSFLGPIDAIDVSRHHRDIRHRAYSSTCRFERDSFVLI